MPKKKQANEQTTSVRVGNISDVSGNVNVAGGNITTHNTATGLTVSDIKQLFDDLCQEIDRQASASASDKEDIKEEVREIQSTVTQAVQKNEPVDESFIARRFRNIARMAPDILDVIVASLANPLAGLGVAVKKIAEKAKAEVGST
jgi:hypothetical protein